MKIVSLFCGAGGLDLGLIQAGHTVLWANDNDEDAVATYKANIGSHVVAGDIQAIASNSIPACDIVVGGFPCQGFSQANLKRNGKDERNKLYREFLRIVGDKKPLYFLAENVRGILSLDQGRAIKKIVSDFGAVGYRVQYKVFNAADFGVAQSRIRVIIVGTRNDIAKDLDFKFPMPTHSRRGEAPLRTWKTISEELQPIPDPDLEPDAVPNQEYSKYKITNRNFTGHRRTDPCKPCPTILARGNGKGGVCAIQHPGNHRRLSVRESAAIQGFPLNFKFFGSMNSAYRQVGNAVAVEFARHLGVQLKIAEPSLKKYIDLKG